MDAAGAQEPGRGKCFTCFPVHSVLIEYDHVGELQIKGTICSEATQKQ